MDFKGMSQDELVATRQALLDELKTVQDRKAAVERALQQLAQQPEAAPKAPAPIARAHPAVSGAKRPVPSQSQDTRDAKRVKSDKRAAVWGTCQTILKTIRKPQHARWFLNPVDPMKDQAPGYFDIIKHPMDFKTVGEKLAQRRYTTPLQFRDDMRLVFNNCRKYNADTTHFVRKDCEATSDMFEREWRQKAVEARWTEATGVDSAVHQENPALRDVNLDRIRDLGSSLQRTVSAIPPSKTGPPPDRSRGLTFEEKRKLSIKISNLPGEKLGRVLEIIAESSEVNALPDGEIELDMDTLDNNTCWKLWEYTESVLSGKGVAGGTKPSASGRPGGGGPGGNGGGRQDSPEHSSRMKSNGPSKVAGGGGAAAQGNGASAPAGGRSDGDSDGSSSSDSSDSESSGSDSDDEGRGSQHEKVESTLAGPSDMPKQPPSMAAGGDYDPSVFMSSTARKDGTTILKNQGAKKDIKIHNSDAWAAAVHQPAANGGGKHAAGPAAAKRVSAPAAADPNDDWGAFQTKAELDNQRKADREAREARLKEEQAQKERAKKEEADRVKREAEEKLQKEERERQEARKQEEAKLQAVKGVSELTGQVEFMKDAGELHALNSKTNVLGLTLKADEEDDDDDNMDEI